jgi:hypothetical protein
MWGMNIPISKFKRIRAYVDTSVFGGLNDDEFAEASVRFFENVRNGRFTLLISQMLLDELQPSPELVKRDFESLPQNYLERVEVTDEVVDLAQSYLATGVLPEYAKGDALHVAMATIARADVIISWNFKHIVNFQRIQRFNSVNLAHGYGLMDIRSPLEVEYGGDD